ncbi:hypothetical protein B0H19DRAFT_1157192 [Mycena capillaripes]|nr:hypothetical protein B0H19DRAFT_1157192 [Mycena capillaripes]
MPPSLYSAPTALGQNSYPCVCANNGSDACLYADRQRKWDLNVYSAQDWDWERYDDASTLTTRTVCAHTQRSSTPAHPIDARPALSRALSYLTPYRHLHLHISCIDERTLAPDHQPSPDILLPPSELRGIHPPRRPTPSTFEAPLTPSPRLPFDRYF